MGMIHLRKITYTLSLILTCIMQDSLVALQQQEPTASAPAALQQHDGQSDKKEVSLRIFNTSPVAITVRYATSKVPALTETIPANTAKTIERDPEHPIIYSFGDAHAVTFPITPDMIMNGEVTIHPLALTIQEK